MNRIVLADWNGAQTAERATTLRAAGYEVAVVSDTRDPASLRAVTEAPPDALVISLSRRPSLGRDLALWLRSRKATRRIPLVFVDGTETDVAPIRRLLPDAVFVSWRGIRSALRRAIASPPTRPASPGALAGYSGTPLVKKLGVKPGSNVALVGAPAGFETTLGVLPAGARLSRRASRGGDVVLLFAPSRALLARRLRAGANGLERGSRLWILWPKQASGVPTDVTQTIVRREGLDAGLVDFKVAAIDAVWSGLCFVHRRS